MKQSAGILLYKFEEDEVFFFLVHPGGPFFAKKDDGFWTIPKGEIEPGEEPLDVAKREFHEETGQKIDGDFIKLNWIKQKGGKVVHAWAVGGDIDAATLVSNTFEIEWPPRSGRRQSFPEIDRGAWFDLPAARQKINSEQTAFIDELVRKFGI